MSQRGIVILMYHELEIPGRPLCSRDAGYSRYVVAEEDFRAQIDLLRQTGYRGVSVGEALAIKLPNAEGPTHIAISFDDGCETDLVSASVILKEAGFNATFYVTVGFVGRLGYLDTRQLQELSKSRFEIGCHSMTHAYLTDLDNTGLQSEITDAKSGLEQILGKPVEHFSCPGGRFDARTITVARHAGFRSVANSRVQANTGATDRYELGRVAILRNTAVPEFQQICNAKGFWKLRFRDTAQHAAKRLLGNALYDRGRARLLRNE